MMTLLQDVTADLKTGDLNLKGEDLRQRPLEVNWTPMVGPRGVGFKV